MLIFARFYTVILTSCGKLCSNKSMFDEELFFAPFAEPKAHDNSKGCGVEWPE
jgi:hypothetical protein